MKDKKSLMRAIVILTLLLFIITFSGNVFALESTGGKWVLVNTSINPKNAEKVFVGGGPTPGYYTDKRYEGRTATYTVAETSMSYHDHRMEWGEILYFDITLKADFDKPPAVLIPGETVNLSATVSGSGSGSDNVGGGGMSLRFLYTADGRFLRGFEQSLVIHGSVDGPGESSSRNGSFVVPNPSYGKEIKITAGLMNCPACQVEWIYRLEGEDPPEIEESIEEPYEIPTPDCRERPEHLTSGVRAQLIRPSGDVSVYSAAFEVWKGPIGGEVALRAGDMVRTGKNGRARVVFDNLEGARDTVDISPNSLMEIPWEEEEIGFGVMLWNGIVRLIGDIIRGGPERSCSPFNVRTPTVVVGTRGTDFLVSHNNETGVSTITVNEGIVDVSPLDDPEDVHELSARQSISYDGNSFEESEVTEQKWKELLLEYGFPDVSTEVLDEEIVPLSGGPMDNDAGDTPGTPTLYDEDTSESDGNTLVGILVLIILAVAIFLAYKKMRK